MLLCAITDRRLLGEEEHQRRDALLALARTWARGGVDYIQIREKDLRPPELLRLARSLAGAVREEQPEGSRRPTRILLNGAPEVALEAGADGVHLTGSAAPGAAAMAEDVYARAGRQAIISRSCHSAEEARRAGQVSLLLFAPVYEKAFTREQPLPGQGLAALAEACRAAPHTPVLALGGITARNAPACLQAGARGVAAIRLFLTGEWHSLRESSL